MAKNEDAWMCNSAIHAILPNKIPRIASRDNATCILASVGLPFHQGVCR